ncbi:hypothetical protein KKF34_13255 [Myxococcota bacterium]|nr:hypothetical protein [Myxococcota bacterium]MBU1381935.1 hypothetical protein [Myxococcota bacterium]MBU1497836.1 hypothetical protein [Myxococcota bacterium]
MKFQVSEPVNYTIFLEGPFGPLPVFIKELTHYGITMASSSRIEVGDNVKLIWKSMGHVLHETIGTAVDKDDKTRSMKILFNPRNSEFEKWIEYCTEKGLMNGFAPVDSKSHILLDWSDGLFRNLSVNQSQTVKFYE